MSERNTLLIEELGKLLGDSLGGKLANNVADLLRLERKAWERSERKHIIALIEPNKLSSLLFNGEVIIVGDLIEPIKGKNE